MSVGELADMSDLSALSEQAMEVARALYATALEEARQQEALLSLARAYLLSASPVHNPLLGSLMLREITQLALAAVSLAYHLCVLLACVLLAVAKLVTVAIPYIVLLIRSIVHFHRTQLTRNDILIEVATVTLLCLTLRYYKSFLARYKTLEASVAAKSKYAAKVLPHASYFIGCFLFSLVGQKLLRPVVSPSALPAMTLLAPLLLTCLPAHLSSTRALLLLKMWTLLALYHATASISALIPFSRYIVVYLPLARQAVLAVFIWLFMSPTFLTMTFDALGPFIASVKSRVPHVDIGIVNVLEILEAFLVRRKYSVYLILFVKGFIQEAHVFLLTLLFCCVPTFIANFGVVLIVILIPALKSYDIALLAAKKSKFSDGDATAPDATQFMLQYWTCFSCLWLQQMYVYPRFWPSVLMMLSLWLSNSFFLGAQTVVCECSKVRLVLSERHNRILKEKELFRTPMESDAEEEPPEPLERSLTDAFVTPLEDSVEPRLVDDFPAQSSSPIASQVTTPLSTVRRRVKKSARASG